MTSSAVPGSGTSAKPQAERVQLRTLQRLCLPLTVGWAAMLWYLSSQAAPPLPSVFELQDKLEHLIAYALLGLFGAGSMIGPVGWLSTRSVWLVSLLCLLYGILDEYHQSFVPGRTADIMDVVADCAGGLLGAWLMYAALPRLRLR